jgi:hypothetical protein
LKPILEQGHCTDEKSLPKKIACPPLLSAFDDSDLKERRKETKQQLRKHPRPAIHIIYSLLCYTKGFAQLGVAGGPSTRWKLLPVDKHL